MNTTLICSISQFPWLTSCFQCDSTEHGVGNWYAVAHTTENLPHIDIIDANNLKNIHNSKMW